MIKAILFDFDGVLTVEKTGSGAITAYLAKSCGIPIDKVKAGYGKYNKGLLCGEYTHEDILRDLGKELGKKITYAQLQEAFLQVTIDEKIINLIKDWKKSYKTGMITDNKVDRIAVISEKFELGQFFDVVSVSAAFHSGKKESLIFEETIKRLNVQPEECIFIDNTKENLIVPEKMGMAVIHFDDEGRDSEKFQKRVEEIISQRLEKFIK